jgi:hypothetical protein
MAGPGLLSLKASTAAILLRIRITISRSTQIARPSSGCLRATPEAKEKGTAQRWLSIPGTQAATQGFKFEDHSKVVLERFEVLWPNDRASELVYISRQRDNAIPEKSILEGA